MFFLLYICGFTYDKAYGVFDKDSKVQYNLSVKYRY